MATISSIFKMQDNATKTFNNVSGAIDDVISKADMLSSKSSNLDPGISSMNSGLSQAISKYQDLITKQDQVNAKIEMMSRQEKLLLSDLNREKSSYNQNEKAIFRIEKSLMNVRNQKDNLIKQSDRLTNEIYEQASAVNKVAENTGKIEPPQGKVEGGFKKWQTNVISINQGLQLAKTLASGVGKVLNYSDDLTLTKARIDMINDGTRTTAELQNEIYYAAQRSRGSYEDMSKSVAKLGLLAGDNFKNNDEMIAFSEMMNKSFKVSGASQQEISSATYQLTQAMAAGKLQGDEFRAIMENAPMLADAIAKYMGKTKGELKELSSEGVITSDIIKAALFNSADDINAKFEQMPKTFGDAMTNMKNVASRYLQPVADKITAMLNSEEFNNILNGILRGIQWFAGLAMMAFEGVGNAINFLRNNMWLTIPIITAVGVVMGVGLLTSINNVTWGLIKQAAAWLAANWQIALIAGVLLVVIGVMVAMKAPMEAIVGVILLIVAALAAWKIAQWAANTAMYACPIVWIIVLVIALVAAIYLFIQWIGKATGLATSGLGMIAGGVMVVIGFFKNLGLAVANIALGIWNAMGAVADNIRIAFGNAIKSVQSWFWGLLETGTEAILGIVKALNKLPFVDIDTSGLENKAKDYAKKKADAEGSKEDYKSISEAFDKGMNTFETFKDGWVMEEFNKGAAWGDSVANSISDAIGSFDPTSALGDLLPDDPTSMGQEYDFGALADGAGNIPVDIKKNSDKEVDISDEDLKMLKDIATREYMLNYKHVTPNVNIQFGDVKETADVNKIKKELEKMMDEELSELYVVEEA